MSADSPSPQHGRTVYSYDVGRLTDVREPTDPFPRATTYTYTIEAQPMAFNFEHNKQKRLFILTGPDGKAEHFRDNPARQLLVEPDPISGEMRPVIKDGRPVYAYLCREEREGQ